MPSERISKKRVKTLANNIRKTNLGEMQKVVEALFLDHDMDPLYLKGLLSGTAAMIEDEPIPIYGAPGYAYPEPEPPKQVGVYVSGVVRNVANPSHASVNFIQVIKQLRLMFGWQLKEAKESAELLTGEGGYLVDDEKVRVVFDEGSPELKKFKKMMAACGARVKTVELEKDER